MYCNIYRKRCGPRLPLLHASTSLQWATPPRSGATPPKSGATPPRSEASPDDPLPVRPGRAPPPACYSRAPRDSSRTASNGPLRPFPPTPQPQPPPRPPPPPPSSLRRQRWASRPAASAPVLARPGSNRTPLPRAPSRPTPGTATPSSTSPQSWTWASLPRQTAVSKKDRFNNTLRLKFKAGCLWVLQTGFLFPLQGTLCTACTPCPTTRGASWGGTTQPSARTLRWSSGTATTTPGAQRTLFL